MLSLYFQRTLAAEASIDTQNKTGTLTYDDFWVYSNRKLSPFLCESAHEKSTSVFNYFSNLLPECDSVADLARVLNTSKFNPKLIALLGNNTNMCFSAAILAIPSSEKSIVLTKHLIEKRLSNREHNSLMFWEGHTLNCVPGVQDKICVNLLNDEFTFIPNKKSSHILKFSPTNNQMLSLNEYAMMRLAKFAGLKTPSVTYAKFGQHSGIAVSRFDLNHSHCIDACQLLNLPPHYKYEQNYGNTRDVKHIRDGVSHKLIFDSTFTKDNNSIHRQLVRACAFNIAIGNMDAHGKNFSFEWCTDELRLCPFYDLVSTQFIDSSSQMSMAVGDEFEANKLSPFDICEFLEQSNLLFEDAKSEFISCLNILTTITSNNSLLQHLVSETQAGKDEKHYLSELILFVHNNAKRLAKIASNATQEE